MGHIYRCLRLAQRLRNLGVESAFVTADHPGALSLIRSAGFSVHCTTLAGSRKEAGRALCESAVKLDAIIYIDLRGEKRWLVEMTKRRGIVTVVYDDVFEPGLRPALLINPSESDSSRYTERDVKYLFGRDYMIVDPELDLYRKHKDCENVQSVFVCFGGADPCNLTCRVVSLLVKDWAAIHLNVVVGPGYEALPELRRLAMRSGRVAVHHAVVSIAPLIGGSDVAIVSGGTVMCEAIRIAIPTLVLPSIEHEVIIAEAYKSSGVVASVSADASLLGDEILRNAIARFLDSASRRRKLFWAASAVRWFNGAELICNRLRELVVTG